MMDVFTFSERAMRMDDRAWARHASPASVYSRIAGGTLVFFALWSVFWIGWLAAMPVALALAWVYLNPRLFAPPRTTASWATRGVLGERAFLNRRNVPVPPEHVRAAHATTALAVAFLALAVWGFWTGEFWTAFAGWHGSTVAKLWFCDRMAWLWGDVADAMPTYRRWSRAEWEADALEPPAS